MKNQLANPQFICNLPYFKQLATILIQEIVGILKQPPFNEVLTLISFDEKREYIIIKISKISDMNFSN
jgi:hypothetical protein